LKKRSRVRANRGRAVCGFLARKPIVLKAFWLIVDRNEIEGNAHDAGQYRISSRPSYEIELIFCVSEDDPLDWMLTSMAEISPSVSTSIGEVPDGLALMGNGRQEGQARDTSGPRHFRSPPEARLPASVGAIVGAFGE